MIEAYKDAAWIVLIVLAMSTVVLGCVATHHVIRNADLGAFLVTMWR